MGDTTPQPPTSGLHTPYPSLPIGPAVTTTATISISSSKTYGEEGRVTKMYAASPAGRNMDILRVAPGVSGVSIKNINGETSGSKIAAVVSVSGNGTRLYNITQEGTGRLMTFSGAQALDADLLIAKNGKQSEYSIYSGGDATPSRGCRIRRFDLWVGMGDFSLAGTAGQQHGIRCHNHHDLTLGDATLRLPWNNKYSFYIKDTSPYGGCGITLKEGTNPLIQYGRCDGPWGFGPLDVSRGLHPDWKLDGLEISHCELNTPSYLHFGWGVINVNVHDTIVRAVAAPVNHQYDITKIHGSCLIIDSASSGKFTNVQFFGDALCDPSNRPNLKNWTFTGCTLNGKSLGLHGE